MRISNGLYTLLQVLPTADPAVIEAAYKALMKRYHPDLHNGEDAERRAAEINHAFTVLRDPERRAAYDAEERAREERYRVELARAFPEANPSGSTTGDPVRRAPPPASGFKHPSRPGERAAAWVGAAGAILLAGTIILFARNGSDRPVAVNAETQPARSGALAADVQSGTASPAAAPVPFRDQPVEVQGVARAVAEFARIAAEKGIPGAAAYSERCFEAQSRTLSIGDFDHCVAFDHVAGRADFIPADATRAAAFRRFQPQNQVARHVRAADPMADTFASIEIRLYEIRRLADAASAQLPQNGVPQTAGATTQPPVAQLRRYTARRDQTPRRTAPPARQRQARDQDFLEREGGIY